MYGVLRFLRIYIILYLRKIDIIYIAQDNMYIYLRNTWIISIEEEEGGRFPSDRHPHRKAGIRTAKGKVWAWVKYS